VTEVERFFRQIVRNLSGTDPARLRRPLPLSDIRDHIVPYRTNRRQLDLESSEDYELVLLRLCAGEGGFAWTEPAEVRVEFEIEIASSNPDLGILRRHESAVVCLEINSLGRALDPAPDLAFAPPDHPSRLSPSVEPLQPLPELESLEPLPAPPARRPPEQPVASRCIRCKGTLPAGRPVNFCPHCGGSQSLTHCPVCEGELEAGWRHCVSCGYLISDG
jgi:hypothetical protein